MGWFTYFAVWAMFPAILMLVYGWHPPTSLSEALTPTETQISSYDSIIHKYAQAYGLDWRLVASMISVESSFQLDAVSPRGAQGLMQIMPVVAREQNVELSTHPDENIRTGIAHFAKKLRRLKGRTYWDALKLSLAAYNVGLGHLRDAQNLAMELGKSPRTWDSVSQALVLLEDPEFYSKAKYGYCQGSGVNEYVSRVVRKYQSYLALYPTRPVKMTQSEPASADPRT